MAYFDHICLYSDGGSKGNPGPGAIGIIICDGANKLLYEYSDCIGHCTNNQAEYKALIKGLDLCAMYTRRRVTCYSDSELVIKQMNGVYRLKNDVLRTLYHEVIDRTRVFDEVIYQHVPRSNQRLARADHLVNQANAGQAVDKCLVNP
jgi:ribonuclease HI